MLDMGGHNSSHCLFHPPLTKKHYQFCYTPKHGSWLNIAENELSSLTRQCVDDERFGDIESLREATAAWATDVNSTQRGAIGK